MKLIQFKDNLNKDLKEVVNPDHFLTIEMEVEDGENISKEHHCYSICGYTLDEGRIEIARYKLDEEILMKKDFATLMQWLSNGNRGEVFNQWTDSKERRIVIKE